MAHIRSLTPFADEIIKSFKGIKDKYDLEYIADFNDLADLIKFRGPLAEIQFTYDRGDLRCSFCDPTSGRRYLVNLVYELLYPQEKLFTFSVDDPIGAIQNYSKVIEQRLSLVMLGDFSWSKDYH